MDFTNCQFGQFQLNKRAYQLRHNGVPVKLERIPLDLLILLIDRPGQLVSREEIFQTIWGKNLFLDADTAINSAVRKIRRALFPARGRPSNGSLRNGRGRRSLHKCASTAEQTA